MKNLIKMFFIVVCTALVFIIAPDGKNGIIAIVVTFFGSWFIAIGVEKLIEYYQQNKVK